MPKLNAKTLAILVALATVPAGCFDPLVEDPAGGTETNDPTAASTESGDAIDDTTAMEPDSGSNGEPLPMCGNGVVEGDEACDDGVNDGSYGGCNADCSAQGPFCGDRIVNEVEACDDGDDVDGNGCNVDCVVSGTVLWTVTYDGPDQSIDSASDVTVDSMGNVIVSGNQSIDGGGAGWLRKYTSDGATVWTVDVIASEGDAANGPVIALLDDDIVFGGSFDAGGVGRDAWLWRYSAVGEPAWTQTYASPQDGYDTVSDVDIDANGYFYVLFQENNAPTETTYRTFVRKYSPAGSELWTRVQDDDVRGRQIAIDGQNDLVVAGTRTAGGVGTVWLEKMTSDGGQIWTQPIEAGEATRTDALSTNDDGSIVIIVNPGGGPWQAKQLATDGSETGTIFIHASEATVLVTSAHLEDNGNLIVGGTTVIGDDDVHGWVSKYTSQGDQLWTNTHDGAFDTAFSFDNVASVTTDSNGNVIAGGRIHDSANMLSNAWVAKYAP